MKKNKNSNTVKLSFESKDRAVSLLRTLVRASYFDSKLPNDQDLSRLLRMPKTAVILALQHLQAEGLLEEEKNHTGYRILPDGPASLVGQVLFMVNTDILRGWFSLFQDWLVGFEQTMFNEGYKTQLVSNFTTPTEKIEVLRQHWQRGIMGCVFSSHVEPSVRNFALESKIPSVLLGNAITVEQRIGLVCSDNRAGAKAMLEYLADVGHERIAFYTTGLSFHDGFRERFQSYQQTMRMLNLAPMLQFGFADIHHEFMARRAAELYYGMPEKPTAIFCSSDREAFELVSELRHLEISVPGHVSVCGFDNNHFGRILEPPMTTMDIHATDMGRISANYLLNEMQAPQLPVKIMVPTDLVVRESVASLNGVTQPRSVATYEDSGQLITF